MTPVVASMMLSHLLLCLAFLSQHVAPFSPLQSRSLHPVLAKTPRSTSSLASVPTPLDTLTSGLASICRFPKGVSVEEGVRTDSSNQLVKLYDVENDRECRRVRERITELDLTVTIVPATSASRVFSDDSAEHSLPTDATIPRLVVKTDLEGEMVTSNLSGAEEILAYLDGQFASPALASSEVEENPQEQVLEVLRDAGNYFASILRIGRGTQVSPAAALSSPPSQPLQLYSYEGNQFCRLVREVLTELDLVYELRSAGKGSPRREELAKLTGGSTQCPYLVDPNTKTAMFESKDIVRYLYKTYAKWTPPSELLEWASDVIIPLIKPLFQALAPLQAGSKREDQAEYLATIQKAKTEIEAETQSHPVVVYTYSLSPFCSETTQLLDNLEIKYKEISLGKEWLPGLIAEGGAEKRAALLEMTGQSSLPNVFIGGKSFGGLFSGSPGLVPALKQGILKDAVANAEKAELEPTGAFE